MSAIHVFYVIIAVLAISVILVIINLVYHLRISSRLTNLEEDVEKKSLEFDALKKERAAGHGSGNTQGSPVDLVGTHTRIFEAPVFTETTPQPADENPIEEGSIQIVRNVGGTFETTEKTIHGQDYSDQSAATGESVVHPEVKTTPEQAPVQPPAAPALSQTPKSAKPAEGVVIPLFSQVINGPDFNQLYKALVEALKKSPATVTFDLANIESLSDGELDYLEKIKASLVNQHRPLALINCPGNLAALMQRRPAIASLIR